MSETFEAGQKVKHETRGEGEVTYGPFPSEMGSFTGYVVRFDGTERLTRESHLSAIPETPKFSIGDTVSLATRSGAEAVVEYGPFDGGDVYVVKLVKPPANPDDPQTFTAMAHVMTKVDEPVKVGDRVRILRATYAEGLHGMEGVVTSVSETWRSENDDTHPYIVRLSSDNDDTVHVAELERVDEPATVTFTHNGVVYDLTAKYRDRDHDHWEFTKGRDSDGIPVMHIFTGGYGFDESLSKVVEDYGPLTRV